jgi:hypothetical protein
VAKGDGQSGASLWAIVYCVGAVWLWLWLWLWLCGVWLASALLTALRAPQSLQSPVPYLAINNNWEVISYQEIRKLAVGHDARRICKISRRMHSCIGPQLLLACEWRDAFVETSVGYVTHRTPHFRLQASGTSNDAPDIRWIPLTGSKKRFSPPNGSQNRAGQRQHGRCHTWSGLELLCLCISGLSLKHFQWAKKSRWPAGTWHGVLSS